MVNLSTILAKPLRFTCVLNFGLNEEVSLVLPSNFVDCELCVGRTDGDAFHFVFNLFMLSFGQSLFQTPVKTLVG